MHAILATLSKILNYKNYRIGFKKCTIFVDISRLNYELQTHSSFHIIQGPLDKDIIQY